MKFYLVLLFTTITCVYTKAQQTQEEPKVFAGSVYVRQNAAELSKDTLYLDMDISLNGLSVNSSHSLLLIPVLYHKNDSLELPYIRVNGKHNDRMYRRSLLFGKEKSPDKESYIIMKEQPTATRVISYKNAIVYKPWMKEAGLLLKGVYINYNGKPYDIHRDILIEDLRLDHENTPGKH